MHVNPFCASASANASQYYAPKIKKEKGIILVSTQNFLPRRYVTKRLHIRV